MNKFKSLIFGGSRGIGSVINSCLKKRGDLVFSCSRTATGRKEDIVSSIENFDYRILKHKFDNLIFSHRYRGEDPNEDFKITVNAVSNILENSDKFLNKNGSIVILSSMAYNYVFKEQSPSYHLTRGALVSLAKYYAVKLGSYGIRCNVINPGTVNKPENKNYYSSNLNKKKYLEILTPLKRMGESKDIADLALFLCSEKSSFITGQVISVDGGMSLLSQENAGNIILNSELKNE